MKKTFMIVVALMIILSGAVCSASEYLIEASGDYIMDSRLDETPASATARAREEAKRAAVEKAGVYLESYSRTINLELDTDEVRTVAARLLKIQDESRKVDTVGENLIRFTVTIKALVDDIDENVLKNMMQDRQRFEELVARNKELQERYDALNREMENYRRNFDGANDAQRNEIRREVARNTERFSAVGEFAKGNDFAFRKDFMRALTAYDKALELDSQFAEAYNNRGTVKYELGQFSAAVEDYNSALRLKPNYAEALNNRGNAYASLEQFQSAANDLQAALRLDDSSAAAHNNLGSVYLSQKNFNAAVEEYTRAIQLNPNYAEAYYNRAVAYYAQGNSEKAVPDLQRALALKPGDADIRALYEKLGR